MSDVPLNVSALSIDSNGKDDGNDCLIVFRPRTIMDSIVSIRGLNVSKIWIVGYNEANAVKCFNQIIQKTSFTNYFAVMDDVVVTQDAFSNVQSLLTGKSGPVCGFAKIAEDSNYLTLSKSPLKMNKDGYFSWDCYDFYSMYDLAIQQSSFSAWYSSFIFIGMSRDMWLKYPLEVNLVTKKQSAAMLSYKLSQDKISFLVHPLGYIKHLKTNKDCTYAMDTWAPNQSIVCDYLSKKKKA